MTRVLIAAAFACIAMRGKPAETSTPKELFERGQQSLKAGNSQDAERDFYRLIEMGVRSAAVYTNLGVVYLRMGKLDRAVEALKKAKELAPAMAGIDLNLGLAYYKQREFKQAVPYFANLVSAEPANFQAHYLKGVCHFMLDEFAAAVAEMAPLQEQERDDLEFLFMLGVSYGKVKDADEARDTFARLVQSGGVTPHLHLLLGKAYLALGDFSSAAPELEKAVADPLLPYSHYYLGVLDEKLGKLDAAAAQFEKETEISPNDPWAFEDLSRIKLNQGDTAGVIDLLERAVAQNPDAPTLRSALAKAHMQKAEPVQAIPHLRRAIELDPKNGNYHYQLGRAYMQMGRQKEGGIEMAKARALQQDVLKGQMELLTRDGAKNGTSIPSQLK